MHWMLAKDEKATLAERVKLLYWNATTGVVITLAAFFGVCIMQLDNAPNYLVAIYMFLMGLICAVRLVDARRKLASDYDFSQTPDQDFATFSAGVLATGLVWASFSVTFMQHASLIELSFNAIILAALTGGALSVLGAVQKLVFSYTSLLLVPYCVAGFFVDIENFAIISMLGLGYWLVSIKASFINSQFIQNTLEIADQNTKLLSQLTQEKTSLSESNKALSEARSSLHAYTHQLEQKVQERTDDIMRLSNLDSLTNLYNRKVLQYKIEQALAYRIGIDKHTKASILFIDLNGFKEINDQMGHYEGDQVLQNIAERLNAIRQAFTPHITLGRWGGDEFVMLAMHRSEDNVSSLVEMIQHDISKPLMVAGVSLSVECSIGVSCYPDHAQSVNKLIQYADMAMYENKRAIKNTDPIFREHLLHKHERQRFIKIGLNQAIEKRELHLAYQPIVDTQNSATCGIEALLRWQHADELISPAEFIPVAEKSELIVKIGLWVLKRACEESLQLCKQNKLYLSVNISAMQLKQADFIDDVRKVLAQTQFPAQSLQLEITESLILEEKDTVAEVISTLRQTGIRIAIDDFGTGYSSLKQLQDVPFDAIKIDRSFIINMTEKDIAILTAADFIARQLNAATIVEGVESIEQLNSLRSLGFKQYQGYYFARPMPADALPAWFETQLNLPKTANEKVDV
ncbi:putative bifunctional diguanylate cyclase/phosphodiesterase [Glaciecola siphonariae]|uniref:Bifunctional diguanylate cyclase/phosphodiesterase n=1 Tax=Glaciecola siphonariae TaxID=521012 RepID=A0ABV9LW76_9ALTE